MKINNYILYFIILLYIAGVLSGFEWESVVLITLSILLICISINYFTIKSIETVEYSKKPKKNLHISVIIPAWNEEKIISRTIEGILSSSYPDFNVIIVAGGNDNTFKYVDHFTKIDSRITVIEQKPLGKSAALNAGLKYATGNIVVFLDADCIVDKNWLEYLVAPIINKEAEITIGNFQPSIVSWVSQWYYLNNIYLKRVKSKKNFFGGSVAFEKKIFNDVNGINENTYADDYYLSTHLEKKSAMKFIEKSIVQTDIPFTLIQYLQVETRWLRILLHTTFHFKKRRLKVIFSFLNNIVFTLGLPVLLILFILGKIPDTYVNIWVGWFFFLIILNTSKPLYIYKLTSNKIHLKYVWVAILFSIIDYLLGFYALITYKKVSPFFEGPRKL